MIRPDIDPRWADPLAALDRLIDRYVDPCLHAHLADDDDNAAEFVRRGIRALQEELTAYRSAASTPLAEAHRLVAEVNRGLPPELRFEFAVVELPTVRTVEGKPYWQAYEDQGVTGDGANLYIDGELIAPVDIAYGLGAALIAASRHV